MPGACGSATRLANVDGKLTLLEPKTERSRRTVCCPRWWSPRSGRIGPASGWSGCVAGSRWVDTGHVFATTLGTPLHAATVTRAFQAALERAGLPRSRFHDLRHRRRRSCWRRA